MEVTTKTGGTDQVPPVQHARIVLLRGLAQQLQTSGELDTMRKPDKERESR